MNSFNSHLLVIRVLFLNVCYAGDGEHVLVAMNYHNVPNRNASRTESNSTRL